MCESHPFGLTHGATCVLPLGHRYGHRFESAWLADSHTEEPADE